MALQTYYHFHHIHYFHKQDHLFFVYHKKPFRPYHQKLIYILLFYPHFYPFIFFMIVCISNLLHSKQTLGLKKFCPKINLTSWVASFSMHTWHKNSPGPGGNRCHFSFFTCFSIISLTSYYLLNTATIETTIRV